MGTSLYKLMLLLAAVSVCSCIQWSSSALKEDAAVYTCDNSDLTLSWDVSKTTGETIVDVQWYYEGRSQELIAMLAHGHLNVMPAFSGRVELTANAGIVIHHVTSGEKGNYSVEVTGMDSSGHLVTLRRTVMVAIAVGLMTTDGQLHASQMAVAVFSNSTQQWHVALACGTFTYPDTPPFTMEWTTPSGQSVSSSQYKEGQYLLLLDNPVSGGSYTCRVPQPSASVACLHGNSTDVSSTVAVDDVTSRLTLLEAENRQLKGQVLQQGNVVSQTSKHLSGLEEENRQLKQQFADVANQANNVTSVLNQRLYDEITKRVSFHATNLKNTHPSSGDVLIITNVLNNQGNGYNPSAGKFTAPYTGTYCFMATLFGSGYGHNIDVYLMVESKQVLQVYFSHSNDGNAKAASLQAVVSLRAGQSVWLQAAGSSNQFDVLTLANYFNGFLITYDP